MTKQLKKNAHRISSLLLSFILLFAIVVQSYPASASIVIKNTLKAEALKELGLFLGTNKGFELNRAATRAEGAIMLVRLLGAEDEALNTTYIHPFQDVPGWASPYIGYLYTKGLTNGVTTSQYNPTAFMTTNQYITFVLRALGYDDESGLYEWDHAIDFASTIQLVKESEFSQYKPVENAQILRDDVVGLSFNGLFTNQYDSTTNLLIRLLDEEAITVQGLQAAQMYDPIFSTYYEPREEMRAIWIAFLELKSIFDKSPTEESFRVTMNSYFQNIQDLGLNTVFLHVRPYSDAIYPSELFPWSYTLSGTSKTKGIEGTSLSYDPLEIMVALAHEKGLRIDAWINPYRIRPANSTIPLSTDNIAATWLIDGSNRVIKNEAGIFYNPASQDVRDLINNGVLEIINNYDVDGIHFDDYFYPSQKMDYDAKEYQDFATAGGTISQVAWRRENVNLLVRQVYSSMKEINEDLQFGISPQGSFEANWNQQYIDVEKWVTTPGYIDYICPQIYYGYQHVKYPYLRTIEEWSKLVTLDSVELIFGLANYKIGTVDTYAKAGKLEWQESENIIASMVVDAREIENYSGFALYRYDQLFRPELTVQTQVQREFEVLKIILQ